jgi:hypothetical protein
MYMRPFYSILIAQQVHSWQNQQVNLREKFLRLLWDCESEKSDDARVDHKISHNSTDILLIESHNIDTVDEIILNDPLDIDGNEENLNNRAFRLWMLLVQRF